MCLVKFIHQVRWGFPGPNHTRFPTISRLITDSQKCQENLIIQNTVVSQDHLTPEIKLRLITHDCELYHCKATEIKFSKDPFWGFYWPGGQALGRYVLDNKKMFLGKNVIDIGAGCGACAIAAVCSGAKNVLANDIDPLSLVAIDINANLNAVTLYKCQSNLIGQEVDNLHIEASEKMINFKYDIILVGDMFYDTEFSTLLFTWLCSMVKKGKNVLIGDPGRHAMKDLEQLKHIGVMTKLAEYELNNAEHNGFSSAAVYKVEA